jgi:transposase
MESTFRPYEPDQHLLLPPSLREWLPAGHLSHFVSDTVDQLDLEPILSWYRSRKQGNLPYHPAMMLKVLVYCYCTGTFSSRRIAKALEDSVPVRSLAAGQAPDHRTICRFREQHLDAFQALFAQVVRIAAETGLVTLGTLAIDGTKIRADASKRKAMSYARMKEEEERIGKEIAAIVDKAKGEDLAEDVEFGPDFRGDELPEELRRRESRLRKIVAAKLRLEARTKADAEAKAAEAKRRKDEDDNAGSPPHQHSGVPEPKAQENFTDPDSRIMQEGSGAFQQCYNAAIAVDATASIVVAVDVQQCPCDQSMLIPMIEKSERALGVGVDGSPTTIVKTVLADAGFSCERNLLALERREGTTACLAVGREGKASKRPPDPESARGRMAARLKTDEGRARYKERKHLAEPPIGWLKEAMGFRQFSLRGLRKVRGELNLVTMAMNLRRMATMAAMAR